MKLSRWAVLIAAAPALAGCGGFGNAMTAHTDVVARAAGKELKVEEAARLLAANPQIPAEPDMVEALAELWVDYTLLATAAAEDTTLAVLDMDRFILPAREQAIIWKLREQVVRPDTVFTEAELQEAWATKGPGVEVRARHILLNVPTEATPEQRDSVRQLAEQLRARAAGGADFAALAREFSADPGSAAQGGDLGFFGRGRMVAPFEEAAFALQPGEISPVVETPFGYHIIRVEERRQQPLGENREPFRAHLAQQAVAEAEQAYIEGLTATADVQLQPGAAEVTREIAQQRAVRLRGRAAQRPVATYKGGELTTGELADELRTLPPRALAGLAGATDEQVEELLQQVARKELLMRDAARRRVTLTEAEVDSLRAQAREAIRNVVQVAGFTADRLPRGAGAAAAIQARVNELIEGAVTMQRQVPQLDRLGLMLREAYDYEINEGTFPEVIATVQALRAAQPAPAPAPGEVPQGQLPQEQVPPPATPAPAPETER